MEIVTIIIAVVNCISGLIALLALIIKPFRERILTSIARKTKDQKVSEELEVISKNVDILMKDDKDLQKGVAKINEHVLENELERLKSDLFACGAKCRRGIFLYPEQMEHIRSIYTKYHDELGGNGTGKIEYEFICKYYNSQDFALLDK